MQERELNTKESEERKWTLNLAMHGNLTWESRNHTQISLEENQTQYSAM